MSDDARGVLYLVPAPLDFGIALDPSGADAAGAGLADHLPMGVLRVAARLEHWVCENAKTARAFLKRVDAQVALVKPLQQLDLVEWPRPNKGQATPPPFPGRDLLAPALAGHDLGLLAEAGLPAVADPGAALVDAAHREGLRVVALPGASALALAVAASGLNGQSFAFVGYVPAAADARAQRLRELEALSRRMGQTQLMIEAPYRNAALHAALLEHLQAGTRLSVSIGLATERGSTRTDSIAGWRARPWTLPADVPAVFALLAR